MTVAEGALTAHVGQGSEEGLQWGRNLTVAEGAAGPRHSADGRICFNGAAT